MDTRQAGSFLRAFGHGTRLRILAALSRSPLSLGDLTQVLRCPKPRIARHLTYLAARHVVDSELVRGAVVYRLAEPEHPIHKRVLAAVLNCIRDLPEAREDARRLAARRRRADDKAR